MQNKTGISSENLCDLKEATKQMGVFSVFVFLNQYFLRLEMTLESDLVPDKYLNQK